MGNKVHKMPPVHFGSLRPDAPLYIKNETPAGFETWVGVAGAQGRRRTMEDATAVTQKDDLIFFGVFDGHGGSETSELLASTFPSLVLSAYPSSKPFANRKNYLVTKAKEMDQTLFHFEDGSTAVFGVLDTKNKQRLDVGNLGDSRLLVIYGHSDFNATEDHKPEDSGEMKRISNAGGFVKCYLVPPKYKGGQPRKMCRVNGNLATSRAFGDFNMGLKSKLPGEDSLKYAVSDVPEVYERPLTNANFIVLACDGLWDVMMNEEVAQFLMTNKEKSPFELASALVTKAYDKGSTDNISVVVVDLYKGPVSVSTTTNPKEKRTKPRHRSRSIEAKKRK